MALLNRSFFSFLLIFLMLAMSTQLPAKEETHPAFSVVGCYTAFDEFSNYNMAINEGGTLIFSTISNLESFDGKGMTKGTTWTGCWKKS